MWVQRLLCERRGRELASLRREELVRRGPEQDAGGGAAPREAGRSVPYPGKQQEGLLRLLCGVSTHHKIKVPLLGTYSHSQLVKYSSSVSRH